MDVQLYFNAVNFFKIQAGEYLKDKYSLGAQIEKNTYNFLSPKNTNIDLVLIGVPSEDYTSNKGTAQAPDYIRKYLYPLAYINSNIKIIDLGNLKKGKTNNDIYYAIRDVVDYFNEKGAVTVVLGGGQDISVGIARAFKDEKYFQFTSVDPNIDIKSGKEPFSSDNYISKILKENPDIFHVNFIGFQSYFVSQKKLEVVRKKDFDAIRLGKLRSDISEFEPLIRNSNFLSFDFRTIRIQDAPGNNDGSPNGLYGEEACQAARYAGISNSLKVFGLFEVNPKGDKANISSKLAAQMIWYFIEGFIIRKDENPIKNSSSFTEYNVKLEDSENPIVFYRHNVTNCWWMQLDGFNKKRIAIACSENDYKLASGSEIPAKWLKFIRKIDRLSK